VADDTTPCSVLSFLVRLAVPFLFSPLPGGFFLVLSRALVPELFARLILFLPFPLSPNFSTDVRGALKRSDSFFAFFLFFDSPWD